MNAVLKRILGVSLVCSTLFIAACSNMNSKTEDQQDLSQLSSLILTLSSRPDITDQSVIDLLVPVADQAAHAFIDALDDSVDRTTFLESLTPIVQTYKDEYLDSPSGVAGVEAKGLALDRLYGRLLGAADQAGISFPEYETALLSAFATLEAALANPLTDGTITEYDHELVEWLWLHSVNDLNQRGYYNSIPKASTLLGVDAEYVNLLRQRMSFAPESFVALSTSLEERLADPLSVPDSNALIQAQLNEEAIRDLFLFKFALEMHFLETNISPIAERMDTMGGVMAGMTAERLFQAGYAMDWESFAAFNWVAPARPISYMQDLTLVDELQRLGGVVPLPPDFSILSGPYLAMAQLDNDLTLCQQIANTEWGQANDEYMALHNQPLSMEKRLVLRQADLARRYQVMQRLVGATDDERQSLVLLLTAFSR